jgi:hypothetical protein
MTKEEYAQLGLEDGRASPSRSATTVFSPATMPRWVASLLAPQRTPPHIAENI